ncbi:hypothetical protein HET64_06065 [Streptomyces sp. McG3]|nr:hypothetical protein [Streptomyces sp. McG3]
MAKASAVIGGVAVVLAFVPMGQPLAHALGGLSLVLAATSTLYNAKAFGWGSDQFYTGVAGMALSIGLGGVGSLAGSMAVTNVGKAAASGINNAASSIAGWFTG